jgi:hypothetical protein
LPGDLTILGAAHQRVLDFALLDGRFFGTGITQRNARIAAQKPVVDQLTLW